MSDFDPHFEPKYFSWAFANGIGTVTLNRPERKNPLTFESYAELCELFRSLRDASKVKAVIITGAAGNFSSGGDVHEIIGPLTRRAVPELLAFTRLTGDLVKAMRSCPQPIIAAVDGVCVGAGAIIAMAADIRFATPDARTAFLFVRVGLAGCDMGACAILPRIIGHGRASDLLFSGRIMSADEGERWGFFNRIIGREQLLAEAERYASDLVSGPTFAHGVTKVQLSQEWNVSIETAIEMEAQAQALCMASADFQRAFEAFSHKQVPQFQGN